MSLQRPPSSNKMVKMNTEDPRSEPDGGAYYADYRKKEYRIPTASVRIKQNIFGFKKPNFFIICFPTFFMELNAVLFLVSAPYFKGF